MSTSPQATTGKPGPKRKLDLLPASQRDQLTAWLKDPKLTYPAIRARLKKDFNCIASETSVVRFYQAHVARPLPSATQSPIVIKIDVAATRNGRILAKGSWFIPLEALHKASVFTRPQTLNKILRSMN